MVRTLASELFREMVSRPPDQVDLAAAALLIALDEYPGLSVQKYLLEIERIASAVRTRLMSRRDVWPMDAIEAMNCQLFDIERFRGNQDDYYDPRNSFLNEVLDRKTGIPITLSLLYLEIGRRVGVTLYGVGMPGHFIVKVVHRGVEILVDPFCHGEILLEEQCQGKLMQILGQGFKFERSYLDAVNSHQILERMLANLKGIYFDRQDYAKVLDVIEKMLLIRPDSPEHIRDRGSVHYKLGRLSLAVRDWARYLELDPSARDAGEVENNLKRLVRLLAGRN